MRAARVHYVTDETVNDDDDDDRDGVGDDTGLLTAAVFIRVSVRCQGSPRLADAMRKMGDRQRPPLLVPKHQSYTNRHRACSDLLLGDGTSKCKAHPHKNACLQSRQAVLLCCQLVVSATGSPSVRLQESITLGYRGTSVVYTTLV